MIIPRMYLLYPIVVNTEDNRKPYIPKFFEYAAMYAYLFTQSLRVTPLVVICKIAFVYSGIWEGTTVDITSALPPWSDLVAFGKTVKGLINSEVQEYSDYLATVKHLIQYSYGDANKELKKDGSDKRLLYGLAETMYDRFKQVLEEEERTPSVEELIVVASIKGKLDEHEQEVLTKSLTSSFQQCQRYVSERALHSIISLLESIDLYFKSIDSAKAMHMELSKDKGPYYFASDSVGLFGRKKEIEALHGFCEVTSKSLLWWVVAGEGGSGKSKLCYKFTKEMEEEGWSVCWPQYRSESDLDKCSDKLPNDTLFVIDYAEDNMADIYKWITTMGVAKYKYIKIRVLLLQRRVEQLDDFADSRIAPDVNYENLRQAMYDEPLWLGHLKDDALKSAINDFAKHRSDRKRRMTKDSTKLVLSKLKEIDGVTAFHEQELLRPLYALILTDAYIQGNDYITSWSITDVLDYVYKNEKKSIRRATIAGCGSIGDRVASDSRIVVAYATIIGGFTVTEEDLEASIPEVYKDLKKYEEREPDIVELFCENRHLLGFKDEKYICPPLEPDIIGEYFVLKVLSELRKKDQRQELIKSAWGRPDKTVAFINRLFKDFSEAMLPEDLAEVPSLFRFCTLPDSVTEIKFGEFLGCIGLTIVEMPSVTEIGDWAFDGCTGLAIVEMPITTKIGDNAFLGCYGLVRVEMPSVTEVGGWSFYGCMSLGIAEMPSVTEIGDGAFYGCMSLGIAEMPSVKKIGSRGFSGTSLTSVDMPSATEIGHSAFDGCTGLTSVKMPSVTEIGEMAFYNCTGLASVEMPSVTKIGDGAFRGCTGLTSVDMPEIKKIGIYAFDGCSSLANIIINDDNENYILGESGDVLYDRKTGEVVWSRK